METSTARTYDREVSSRTGVRRPRTASRQTRRWLVHVGLIVTAVTSLTFEFVLTIHILVGLVFIAFVVAHLVQRRRTSVRLLRRLADVRLLRKSRGRLAVADLVLMLLTVGMFASGLWDWSLGHPTRIRFHALLGVGLALALVTHSIARWKRMRTSRVR